MNPSTERTVFTSIVVAAIFVVTALIGWWIVTTIQNLPAPSSRSNDDLSRGIALQKPSLATNSNQPIFSISKQSQLEPGWYVVHIKQAGITSKIVLRDSYRDVERMQIVAGPSTKFSAGELQTKGLTADLIEGILKS